MAGISRLAIRLLAGSGCDRVRIDFEVAQLIGHSALQIDENAPSFCAIDILGPTSRTIRGPANVRLQTILQSVNPLKHLLFMFSSA